MSWRGESYPGEFPSLGRHVLKWAKKNLTVPDGPYYGQPLVLTSEQAEILIKFYGLDDKGRWLFRRAAVRRAKGWGKSPLLGMIALAELCGPSRFAGWSAKGEPLASMPEAPWVQIAAVSEDQTDNTYNAIHSMAADSPLNGSVIEVGRLKVTRIDGPGRLEPVTAAAGSREGQRIDFAVLDETHLWTKTNGGHKLAATIRRNAGKMGGRTFESTNAHSPGEDSVAERTLKDHQAGVSGLLYDTVEAPWVDDLTDTAAVLKALAKSYGKSRWVPLERVAEEMSDPSTDPADARRFYFNQLVSSADQFVDIQKWEALAADRLVEPGEQVALGFDGSIYNDSTCLYGCTRDGFLFELAKWERPLGIPRTDPWRVPRSEVHDAVDEAFNTYDVGRMYCDPAKWESEIEAWTVKYGQDREKNDRVVALDTNQARRFAPACRRFETGVVEASTSHDGKPLLTAHLAACARKKVRVNDDDEDGRTMFVIVKADTRKIDAAVAAVLANEAASTLPVPKKRPTWVAGT
jgi:phage terminase large subunit-like protein